MDVEEKPPKKDSFVQREEEPELIIDKEGIAREKKNPTTSKKQKSFL